MSYKPHMPEDDIKIRKQWHDSVYRKMEDQKTIRRQYLGIVENMSGFVCPHCGETVDIFKKGGGEEAARKYGVPFLGRIPLIPEVVANADDGIPSASSNEIVSKAFEGITTRMLEAMDKKKK